MYLEQEKVTGWKTFLVMAYLCVFTGLFRIMCANNTDAYLLGFERKMLHWIGFYNYWINIIYKDDLEGLASIENKTGIITVHPRFKELSQEMQHFVVFNLQIRTSQNNITIFEGDIKTIYKCMKIFSDKKFNFWRMEFMQLLSNEGGSIFGKERFKNVIETKV